MNKTLTARLEANGEEGNNSIEIVFTIFMNDDETEHPQQCFYESFHTQSS